jgi:hypothetical protein
MEHPVAFLQRLPVAEIFLDLAGQRVRRVDWFAELTKGLRSSQ